MVSASRDTGYQHLDELVFDEQTQAQSLTVKLKKIPFKVKRFKIVAPDGHIDWVVTNHLDHTVNQFVAELKNNNRWQAAAAAMEDFHRGFKQLTGSEKCQCRKARSQRNHLACCYHAWVSLPSQRGFSGDSLLLASIPFYLSVQCDQWPDLFQSIQRHHLYSSRHSWLGEQ